MPHPADQSWEQLRDQCDVRRLRRSGPGGQHRNKVETAVVISHRASGATGEASERRSQEQNRQVALQRLRLNLALQVRSPRGEAPSEKWRERCSGGRLAINPDHRDFPSLLAEALDVLTEEQMQTAPAARRLGCTTSQLVKLLKLEPRALQQVNQERLQLGAGPLHA